MSSAILFVTIVAIWACVLIPRWLRRDFARGASDAPGGTVPGDGDAEDAPFDESGSADPVSGAAVRADAAAAGAAGAGEAVRASAAAERAKAWPAAAERQEATAEAPENAPPPLTPEESRQRALAARRRLLGMLLAIEAAAIGLAMLGLAAPWVVIPPSVMLGGYLLLLREAAHADAERAALEREAAARARAQARARAAARAARTAGAAGTARQPAASAAAPGPAYEDTGPGRDFAPGLAGKYTTSHAEAADIAEPADEGYYEQYTETRLRAVGD